MNLILLSEPWDENEVLYSAKVISLLWCVASGVLEPGWGSAYGP